MTNRESHAEIESLLGVFALDAAEPDELAMVEAHLSECPRCRAEVDGLREVAGALGNDAVSLPSHLWDRIADRLGDPPVPPGHLPSFFAASAPTAPAPVAPITDLATARARRRDSRGRSVSSPRSLRWAGAALGAAAVAVIALLAVDLNSADNRLPAPHGSQTVAAVGQALATPGHTVVELRTTEGAEAARLVLLPGGRGYMYDAHMAALPSDETYQLWGLIDEQPISLALLGSDPKQAAITVASSHPTQLMVTVEPAGGVTTPDRAPLASGKVTTA